MDNYLFEVTEAPLPRKKIEDDLLIRHKQLQRKIEALKVRRMKEEVKYNQQVPKINPNSRRIAISLQNSESQSTSRMQRTYEILSNSRFIPKKASICLESLDTSLTPRKNISRQYDLKLSDHPVTDPITFPSIEYVYKPAYSRLEIENDMPSDIIRRNELLKTLRTETVARGFGNDHEEPPGLMNIHERTKLWLKKKEEKLEKLKKSAENKALVGCTFKPKLRNLRYLSVNNTQRTLSSECSYSDLYERKKRFREVKGCKTERNLSQETKPCTAIPSSNRPSSIQSGYISPRYNTLCPVKMSLSKPSQSGISFILKYKK